MALCRGEDAERGLSSGTTPRGVSRGRKPRCRHHTGFYRESELCEGGTISKRGGDAEEQGREVEIWEP